METKTSMIQFNDLARANNKLRGELDNAIRRVLDSGRYIRGVEDENFENEFAEYMGAKYCVGVSNGLDALHLILAALDLPKDSEVIVPANTFIATALSVSFCGYNLRLVDVDEETMLIDASKIEAAINEHTKVIMPVHLYGSACDMDEILKIAKAHGFYVVEDNAQAQGCEYKGRKTGTFGIASGTSFYPGKNIGSLGDGGAVITDDEQLANKIKALANYGSSKKYYHEYLGFNARLDEIQAAVLRVKLKYLDDWNGQRAKIADYYMQNILNPLIGKIKIPFNSVWHIFLLRINDGRRDEFIEYMKENGIGTAIHYPIPIHKQPAYSQYFQGEEFPIAEKLAKEIVTIPMFPYMTDLEIKKITEVINDWK